MRMKSLLFLAMFLVVLAVGQGGISDFDDLSLGVESYWNGSDGSGGFSSGSASFNNSYSSGEGWEAWNGFGYSNITDNVTMGFAGQYNAITGGAESGSNYALGYAGFITPTMTLNSAGVVDGLSVTNTNYAYDTILNGDSFADPFSDGDYFYLTITGKNSGGSVTGSVDTYLADYRAGANYIMDTWEYVDLTSLGIVKSLEFSLTTSDMVSYDGGVTWYANTPMYFAMDTVVPEPASFCLLALGGVLLRRRK